MNEKVADNNYNNMNEKTADNKSLLNYQQCDTMVCIELVATAKKN